VPGKGSSVLGISTFVLLVLGVGDARGVIGEFAMDAGVVAAWGDVGIAPGGEVGDATEVGDVGIALGSDWITPLDHTDSEPIGLLGVLGCAPLLLTTVPVCVG